MWMTPYENYEQQYVYVIVYHRRCAYINIQKWKDYDEERG